MYVFKPSCVISMRSLIGYSILIATLLVGW